MLSNFDRVAKLILNVYKKLVKSILYKPYLASSEWENPMKIQLLNQWEGDSIWWSLQGCDNGYSCLGHQHWRRTMIALLGKSVEQLNYDFTFSDKAHIQLHTYVLNHVRAWFLRIALSTNVCVCVCVHPQGYW